MSYDSLSDVVVEALRAIGKTETNNALVGELGSDIAIVETYGFPAPLEMIEQLRLPALFVYVESEEASVIGGHDGALALSMVFEYVGPKTPIAKLGPRWPLVRTVWATLRDAIVAGKLGGVDTLTPLGVFAIHVYEASVKYLFASDGGENAHPAFVGKIPVHWMDATDPAVDLPALVALFAKINQPSGGPVVNPQLTVKAST